MISPQTKLYARTQVHDIHLLSMTMHVYNQSLHVIFTARQSYTAIGNTESTISVD
jgi:hypothetical protein